MHCLQENIKDSISLFLITGITGLQAYMSKKSKSFEENISFTFPGVICPVKTPSTGISIVYYMGV